MSAPLLVDDMLIDQRWSNRTGRERGDHPLFTPRAEDIRRVAVPPPVAAERTTFLPRLGADGLPVTSDMPNEPAQAAATGAENVTGWSEIDRKIHAINTSLGSISRGLWWSDCDRTVEFIPFHEVKAIGQGAWCPICWVLEAEND